MMNVMALDKPVFHCHAGVEKLKRFERIGIKIGIRLTEPFEVNEPQVTRIEKSASRKVVARVSECSQEQVLLYKDFAEVEVNVAAGNPVPAASVSDAKGRVFASEYHFLVGFAHVPLRGRIGQP